MSKLILVNADLCAIQVGFNSKSDRISAKFRGEGVTKMRSLWMKIAAAAATSAVMATSTAAAAAAPAQPAAPSAWMMLASLSPAAGPAVAACGSAAAAAAAQGASGCVLPVGEAAPVGVAPPPGPPPPPPPVGVAPAFTGELLPFLLWFALIAVALGVSGGSGAPNSPA